MDRLNTSYINSVNYKDLEDKIKELKTILDDLTNKSETSRKLRFAEVDIEAEREAGRLQPDEVYVPLHIIDTNIRREQSPYVQFITQSPRAVIVEDLDDPTVNMANLERDLTKKLRYDGWQLQMFSNIDSFQANGYSVMEVVLNMNNPGELGYETVNFGDFAFVSDTRDLQAVEMTARSYYFTRTKLKALAEAQNPEDAFDKDQIEKVITRDPENNDHIEASDAKDKSLYRIYKVMFRVNGIVHVAWCCPTTCDSWLRAPRPLFIGRRKPVQYTVVQQLQAKLAGQQLPTSENDYEVNFPYILFPYLISENDTISQLKGRVFLDQDLQEATSSLLSSVVTKARRSAGLYFSKDVSDPNDDLMLQKNVFLRSGSLVNSKIQAFNLEAPDPGLFSSIQMLVTANQNETSQVNFAANNRKDSRKTAEEIKTSMQQQQILSVVQVVLFSIALTQMYRLMCEIIKSRVMAGLIKVNPAVAPLYQRKFSVKPSGDIDVIEKQELIKKMMDSWPVIEKTPCAQLFLSDLLELMFPDRAAKYLKAFSDAQQQQQSQQAQQMQQLMGMVKQMAGGIVQLSKKPEMFSETGMIHAYPIVQQAAQQIEQMQQNMTQGKQ